MQTTAVDPGAGIVNLTTVLAHSSGEWIASDWPICAVAETATPHRMGAALTYARRYALFTLVGIAGEDDLDAPDIVAPAQPNSQPPKPRKPGNGYLDSSSPNAMSNGNFSSRRTVRSEVVRGKRRQSGYVRGRILSPAQSSALSVRLVAELKELKSEDDAAAWARRSLVEKQHLTEADEQAVEEAFAAKLATFAAGFIKHWDATPKTANITFPAHSSKAAPAPTKSPSAKIDKNALAYPQLRRLRDRDHLKYVTTQPCLICDRRPCDAHHLRFTQPTALGRKVSDEFTVPLCRGHHRELHHCGDESSWWSKARIDPTIHARMLWLDTHPLATKSLEPIQAAGHRAVAITNKYQKSGEAPQLDCETKPTSKAKAPTHDIV